MSQTRPRKRPRRPRKCNTISSYDESSNAMWSFSTVKNDKNASDASRPCQPFRLFSLPLEIRALIYEQMFGGNVIEVVRKPYEEEWDGELKPDLTFKMRKNSNAFLRASKQSYKEAIGIYYGISTICAYQICACCYPKTFTQSKAIYQYMRKLEINTEKMVSSTQGRSFIGFPLLQEVTIHNALRTGRLQETAGNINHPNTKALLEDLKDELSEATLLTLFTSWTDEQLRSILPFRVKEDVDVIYKHQHYRSLRYPGRGRTRNVTQTLSRTCKYNAKTGEIDFGVLKKTYGS